MTPMSLYNSLCGAEAARTRPTLRYGQHNHQLTRNSMPTCDLAAPTVGGTLGSVWYVSVHPTHVLLRPGIVTGLSQTCSFTKQALATFIIVHA